MKTKTDRKKQKGTSAQTRAVSTVPPVRRLMRLIDWSEAKGVPIKTVRKWVTDRRIPYVKVSGGILVDPVVVEEALRRYEIQEIS